MPTGKRRIRVPPTPADEAVAVLTKIDDVALGFSGQIDELESAIGMLFLGRLFGWKLLVLVHNKRTIRKYEEILGVDVRKAFPEIGPLAGKSIGLDAVQPLGTFWKAVSGELKVPEK